MLHANLVLKDNSENKLKLTMTCSCIKLIICRHSKICFHNLVQVFVNRHINMQAYKVSEKRAD